MKLTHVVMTVLALAGLVAGCSETQQESLGNAPSMAIMKAEQVEAQQLLNQIFKMQQTYHAANRQYASTLGDIGVTIPLGARYSYAVASTGSSWSCSATANLDFDATIDRWVVDQRGGVTCATNDATS
jgi:hypothetical protein